METIEILKEKLSACLTKIQELEGTPDSMDRLSDSFYMGRVGGSGPNTARLNKQRLQSFEAKIKQSNLLAPLKAERDKLEAEIKYLESDGPAKKEAKNIRLAEWWNNLKVGDEINFGLITHAVITKKSRKSIETDSVCKWSISQVIGKQAAALVQ